jgi:hypothetical protein
VYLRPKLDLRSGIAVQRLIVEANQNRADAAELTGLLAEGYLYHGIESWTLLDEAGAPVPVTNDEIRARLLSDFSVSAPVADAADGLYMGPVLLPLVERAKMFSQSTLTNGSTSAPPPGTRKPPKRSKRSSTSTSPTGDIEKTSPPLAGVSNS